ncbi:ABC transporter substrate-binding protein [Actinoplanes xinjiangensis]|uniref:Monosaccharide ABC transporter substrate-binding protein (CUT2 family) n=1 Tax=Actinoplanes xinjiangensis TaxID=512350 RepID=A0A316FKQ3_9ACTN|nr:ABC transporter substrate-binding protein [Actinoplanes xinjiangensis]PWK48692.1 monosaccharide ABC transporter substrate-binding protein (CUT2 family) [Actinoplanes xinjiangensis]GIF38397.1 LacI family transcriptional regulator [Actinoplanes xinjiangensis]
MPHPTQFARGAAAGATLAALVLSAGCTRSAGTGAPAPNGSAAQQVQATSGTTRCTPELYNGGVPKLDLKTATVGFAQSEKEANPFRITETQSIKDEAAKRGIKLITTNAQSDLNKEIADIQGMIAQGAQALIISPLNSEGLDPALKAAQDAKVPVMTIDRLLTTKTPCTDYLGWIGSDFVVQGERAADAMIKATGDQGEVAILLGASGVNVTVDRTKGFKDQLAAKGSKLKVVAEQTGDFTREKGQKVTEQLISANPGISAIYAENDEMALGAVAALKGADKKPGDIKIITIDGTKGAVQGVLDGWIAGVIESNPRFGPLAFQALEDFYSGTGVVEKTIIADKEYTPENAAAELSNAY